MSGHLTKTVHPVGLVEEARRRRRLRQIDLADRAGVSRTLVVSVERGYIPAGPNRAAFARALGVSQTDLWPDEPVWGEGHGGA
jgi:transcriptional regulator with XRE-family HTH domain